MYGVKSEVFPSRQPVHYQHAPSIRRVARVRASPNLLPRAVPRNYFAGQIVTGRPIAAMCFAVRLNSFVRWPFASSITWTPSRR